MNSDLASPEPAASDVLTFGRGDKRYEVSNHLGNVLAVVGDRKIVVTSPSNDDGSLIIT